MMPVESSEGRRQSLCVHEEMLAVASLLPSLRVCRPLRRPFQKVPAVVPQSSVPLSWFVLGAQTALGNSVPMGVGSHR